jgi:hypothetical protein
LAIPIFIVSVTPLVTLVTVVAAASFTWPIIVIVIVPAITNAVALAIAATVIIPLVVAVVTTPSLS